jgi:hypothetical protein
MNTCTLVPAINSPRGYTESVVLVPIATQHLHYVTNVTSSHAAAGYLAGVREHFGAALLRPRVPRA